MSDLKTLLEFLSEATEPTVLLNRVIEDYVGGTDIPAPNYTGSVDAALMLVPPLHTTNIHSDHEETYPTGFNLRCLAPDQYEAQVIYFPTWNVEPPPLGEGIGSNQAIALCIAALHARG